MTPWQMLEKDEKTLDWKMWVADHFEHIGLKQVTEKYKPTIKTRRMGSGLMDMEDYDPIKGEFAHLNKWILPDDMNEPFKKFHPLIPPYLKVLEGEFLKRNLRIYVSCIDRQTQDDKLEYKNEMVTKAVIEHAIAQKDRALKAMGIQETDLANVPRENVEQATQQNEQYKSEIEAAKALATAEQKYKKYRHRFEEFGQLVMNIDYERFHMAELEREAFIETLCNDEQVWHLDMLEDNYKLEFLDNAQVFHHRSTNIKYYSEGDYLGWFEDMTIGDIVNKLGHQLKPKDFEALKEVMETFTNNTNTKLLTTQEEGWQGARYDITKPYPQGAVNVPIEQYKQGEYIRENMSHMSSSDIVSSNTRTTYSTPKMFRVMRLYFRSQRKLGWLTKKDRDGMVTYQDWIDENFKMTINPVYDNSLTKEDTKENLVYGEHIDWEWGNEWRHLIKINNNREHSYWKNSTYGFKPIYLDGERIKYQFTGKKDSPFDVYPPFEGVQYKMKQTRPVSFVNLLAPSQITYNIAMNRIPDVMFHDVGKVMVFNKNIVNPNRPGLKAGADPLDDWMDTMRSEKILDMNIDPDLLRTQGNTPLTPQILDYSRIQEGVLYMQLANLIKENAGETIGISRQRLAQAKASETATGIQAGINYSETQTEPYFHRHIVEFMPRVYERMLDAAQYYCTTKASTRAFYQTSEEGNKFLEVENMDGTAKKYQVKCTSDVKEAEIKEKLTQLFMSNNTTGATLPELAGGIIAGSPQEIHESLRKAQIEKEQAEERKYQQEMSKLKAEEEAIAAQKAEERAFQSEENRLKRESDERIATTRALSGLQSDVNLNQVPDAQDNINNAIRERQILTTQQSASDRLAFDKQKQAENTSLKREDMLIKQNNKQKELAIALANQNKNEDKALNKKIAKDQGVTK